MSVFSNPADQAGPEAARYIAAILEMVGDRDPLDVLRATPAGLEAATANVESESLRRPEAPGKWAMVEVLQHLADAELVWGYRIRMVLAEDEPELTGYDQNRWVERFWLAGTGAPELIATFAFLRRLNLRLLEQATPADLARAGRHTERGPETIEHMIRLNAGHDLVHVAQLRRIRDAVSASGSGDDG